jgi:hypothetical protein
MNAFVFVPPAIAAAFFLVLGVVTWSYRDVYHRHNDRVPYGEQHTDEHAADQH